MVVAHNVPVEVCSNCAEVFSGPEAGRIRDEAIFRAQGPRAATEEVPLTATEIVQLRERLGFSQAEFAAFTGIGEASLSRWERGLLIPSKAHNRYLRLIRDNVENVRLLQAMSGITPRGVEDKNPRKPAARMA
jgi:putative zinc finger/helix-turn-helix YgiT family protein